ncbi:MAG: beta-lactamase class [Bacillota bacterium]|jgi:beta-lactamase class A|nr:beta-lactamase class [Bacillota bacterium]MDK2960726.1 beta-lactamase class [Bacillota bacterium]
MLPEKEILSVLGQLAGSVAVYLEDMTAQELFTVNPERTFPAASTIKIPLLAAVLESAETGKLDLNEATAIAHANRVGGAGVLSELSPNLRPTVRDLATLMIIQSDNTAANQLIDLVGMETVNALCRKLGLKHTVLQRKMMDFEAARAGRDNFTSAADLGRLLKLLLEGKVVSSAASALIIDLMKRQQHRNKLPAYLPADILIAHKTGDLPNLEHDAGIFFLPKRTYTLVVLTDRLPSNRAGIETIARISEIVFTALATA